VFVAPVGDDPIEILPSNNGTLMRTRMRSIEWCYAPLFTVTLSDP